MKAMGRSNLWRAGAAICVWLAMLNGSALGGPATNDDFARGIALGRAGQFPEAAAVWETAAKAHPASGTLLNLGLAEWQRGRAGAAILAWEQARWIDPFDARARDDLKFARQVAEIDEPQLKWYETVSTWLPANLWAGLAAGLFWATAGLILLPGVFLRRKASWNQWVAAVTFGLLLFSVAANVGVVSRTEIGLVVRKGVALRLTPTREGEVVSTVAAGEPGRKLRARGDYVFVRTMNGSGWLERGEFGLICPP